MFKVTQNESGTGCNQNPDLCDKKSGTYFLHPRWKGSWEVVMLCLEAVLSGAKKVPLMVAP